jgi:hypothetical protein
LTGGKKITHAYEGSRSPHASALHEIHQILKKGKISFYKV